MDFFLEGVGVRKLRHSLKSSSGDQWDITVVLVVGFLERGHQECL